MTSALTMAAMMLPGAVPAVVRNVRVDPGAVAAGVFAASYFVLWTLVGLALNAIGEPGTAVAAAVTITAGVYELTPAKRGHRLRCQDHERSGVRFGLNCVGASIGLMAMFAAIGAMDLAWMGIVAAVVLAQKVLPPRRALDIPLAFAIVALGVLVATGTYQMEGMQ